jgi:hypothetical protein
MSGMHGEVDRPYWRTLIVAPVIALSIHACSLGAPNGGAALTQIAGLARSGEINQAKTAAEKLPTIVEIRYLDPSGPAFCTTSAFDARLNQAGYHASQFLVGLYAPNISRTYRYAVASRAFGNELKQQDDFAESLCQARLNEIGIEYQKARSPLAVAMQVEIDQLKTDAVNEVGASNLESASQAALRIADNANTESSKADCKSTRNAVNKPTDPPILKQAREMILSNCQRAGY